MTVKELFTKHNLGKVEYIKRTSSSRSWNSPPEPVWLATIETLKRFYGSKVHCETHYESAYIKCDEPSKSVCKEHHYLYLHTDGPTNYYGYSWPGQGYVLSKELLSIDVIHELNTTKTAELEAARKKRFETIKSPRDAVRLTFRDLDIKVQMVQGNPRFNCGPCDMEFQASKDNDPKVKVAFIYRNSYVHEILLTTLSIADPEFSKKVEALIFNAKNMNKLMLGEVQPKSVNT